MSSRRGAGAARSWLLALAAASGWTTACASHEDRQPSVLLIVVDTLRADHLGCYGYQRPTSPAIDALAKESVRFERAYATAPWTQPSVASMLSGLYPSSHRVTNVGRRLPSAIPILPEILRDAGYATAAVVSHVLVGSRYGFDRGFAHFDESEAPGGHSRASTRAVTRRARERIRDLAAGEPPFFLLVHYFDPHYNYLRHREYGFAPKRVGRVDAGHPLDELREFMTDLRPEEVQFLRDLYDGEIRLTDEGIGHLLAVLAELGLTDHTIVVLTSDHGEEFLTRGWLGHTQTLYDELVRVPLLIRLPGRRARVISDPVSVVSLTPTILELTGVDPPASGFHGDSLAAWLEGGDPAPPTRVFSEVDFVPRKRTPRTIKRAHKEALVLDRFKLIRDRLTGAIELFDLRTDPGERQDLSRARPDLVERLLPLLERQAAIARGEAVRPDEVDLSEPELEELRALGYIER